MPDYQCVTEGAVASSRLLNWPRQDDSKILWMATRHGHADASVACSESGMSRLKPSVMLQRWLPV